jgi:hypothetical protein
MILIIICCSIPNWLYAVPVQPESDRIFSSPASNTHSQTPPCFNSAPYAVAYTHKRVAQVNHRFIERTKMNSVILLLGSVLP